MQQRRSRRRHKLANLVISTRRRRSLSLGFRHENRANEENERKVRGAEVRRECAVTWLRRRTRAHAFERNCPTMAGFCCSSIRCRLARFPTDLGNGFYFFGRRKALLPRLIIPPVPNFSDKLVSGRNAGHFLCCKIPELKLSLAGESPWAAAAAGKES
jgi:hypothetical protein